MRQISRRMKMIHLMTGWRWDDHEYETHKHTHGSWILWSVSRVHSKTMHSLSCITSWLHHITLCYIDSRFFLPLEQLRKQFLQNIQCWAAVLCNNHSNYRSIEKRPCEISCKEQCLLLYQNTLQHWRECLPSVECYKTVFRLNGLDFNGYFEDCKSENTRANHPYKMQMKSAKVNSLKYSFFVKIIKD